MAKKQENPLNITEKEFSFDFGFDQTEFEVMVARLEAENHACFCSPEYAKLCIEIEAGMARFIAGDFSFDDEKESRET